MLLAGVKLRLQIQSNNKYTVLYFLKLSFYFEIHFSQVGRQLELIPVHNVSPCGALESDLGFGSGTSDFQAFIHTESNWDTTLSFHLSV